MTQKILVVDDEKDIVELLEYNLTRFGYKVITASNGKAALEKLAEKPDLVILDVMMPQMSGYEVCTIIKQSDKFKHIPVMFLTAKTSETDEIYGLNLGASDFIQKPISINKLHARVASNLRMAANNIVVNGNINIGPISISRDHYSVKVESVNVEFARKEFEIFFLLASNPGKVFKREKILAEVWGKDVFVVDRTVDVHLLNVRKKLGAHAYLIETIKGVGYKFKYENR
ncbi:MAG: DNA-binding response regulator [Ignavibacteria bacterium]|nr:MAG: DNA-binding response regulator [Ignavibacteria bacterium]KAF0160903.1 MAG: DNA-binding response regulator [Ignavibacteria bacterium]